jgi:hypothetical protein
MALLFNAAILLESGDLANVTGHERKAYLPQLGVVLAAFSMKVRLRLELVWSHF